ERDARQRRQGAAGGVEVDGALDPLGVAQPVLVGLVVRVHLDDVAAALHGFAAGHGVADQLPRALLGLYFGPDKIDVAHAANPSLMTVAGFLIGHSRSTQYPIAVVMCW